MGVAFSHMLKTLSYSDKEGRSKVTKEMIIAE